MPKRKLPRNLEAWSDEIIAGKDDLFVDTEHLMKTAAEAFANENGLNKLNKMLADAQSLLIDAMKEKEATPEIAQRIENYNIQIKILEKSIERRRSMHKEKAYFLEKNVAEAGIFSVPKKAKKSSGNGDIIRKGRKASIRHRENEALTPFDARVLMAIHKLWEIKGKEKQIDLNLYEICSALHTAPTGEYYKVLESSLMRLFRAEIMFEDLNQDVEQKRFLHLMQEVGFETRLESHEVGKEAKFSIIFTDKIFESMKSGYLEWISMALLEDLQSNAAQLLIPILSAEFRKGTFEWRLEDICQMIDVTSPRPAMRKQVVENALSELKQFGVIKDYRIYEDYGGITKVKILPLPSEEIESSRLLEGPISSNQ